jgi:penicillin amidase
LTVRETRHGPVVSDASPAARRALPEGYVLSVRFVPLEPGDHSVRFPLRMARARDVREALEAAQELAAPPQNVVCADVDGGVAVVAAGRVPRRSPEQVARAQSPARGWLAPDAPGDYIPFEQLPRALASSSGALVTANQELGLSGSAPWLGADWSAPGRARRIESQLAARPRHSPRSFAALQSDEFSPTAAELVPRLVERVQSETSASAAVRAAAERLAAWDFVMRADKPEPLIFAAWQRQLVRAVFADELGDDWSTVVAESSERLERQLALPDSRWCEDVSTLATESCASVATRALAVALAQLEQRHGAELESWRWGEAHPAHFLHTPFGFLPVLGSWADTSLPVGGGNDSVSLEEYSLVAAEDSFESRCGPSYRAIYDLADPERSSFIVGVGQSGNPLSPYYRHWADRWQHGERVPMSTRRADFERGAIGTLLLTPLERRSREPELAGAATR